MPTPDVTYVYGELTKSDSITGRFEGYVSSPRVDLGGQIVDPDWLKSQLPPWFEQFGNIREQHDPSKAAGVADTLDLTADPGPLVGGMVVDEGTKKKLAAGVFKGLSVGIKGPKIITDAAAPNGRIVGGTLIEISLVDRPANDDAKLVLVKAVDGGWKHMETGAVIERGIAAALAPQSAIAAPAGSPLAALREAQANPTPALTKTASAPEATAPSQSYQASATTVKDGDQRYFAPPGSPLAMKAALERGATVADILGASAPAAAEGETKAAEPDVVKCGLPGCDCSCAPGAPDPDCDCDCSYCTLARESVMAKMAQWQAQNVLTWTVEADLLKRDFSAAERRQSAAKGHAMPDGSYPIENTSDLHNAIQAYGRAKNPAAVKRHIIRRARALGATSMLPDGWSGSSKEDKAAMADKKASAAAPDVTKAKMPRSEPSHAHPHKGAHNHTHSHESYDGKMLPPHTHAHMHDDDDMHDHSHLMGKDSRLFSPEEKAQALSLYAADPSHGALRPDAAKADATHPYDGTHSHPHADGDGGQHEHDHAHHDDGDHGHSHRGVTMKAAGDFGADNPPEIAPGKVPDGMDDVAGAMKDALNRLTNLAKQTDDFDGDVDFPANLESEDEPGSPAGDFSDVEHTPALIAPEALPLNFASVADLVKAVVGEPLFARALGAFIDARVQAATAEVLTKAAQPDTVQTVAQVSAMSRDLAKGLSVLADNAEATAQRIKDQSDLIKAVQADLDAVKKLAAPVKGEAVVVNKGILGDDTYSPTQGGQAPPSTLQLARLLQKELANASEEEKAAIAREQLNLTYQMGR